MILVIDNYDSFTFNVVQSLQMYTTEEVKVVRNDECTVEELAAMNPKYLVVSPGPGNPARAGISVDAIRFFAGKVPILGICLGHQAIGEAFGAEIVHAKKVCHGIVQDIKLDGKGLFRTIGKSCKFTRYHSLVIDESTLSDEFEITARAEEDVVHFRGEDFIDEVEIKEDQPEKQPETVEENTTEVVEVQEETPEDNEPKQQEIVDKEIDYSKYEEIIAEMKEEK